MYKLAPPKVALKGDLLTRTTSYPEIVDGCRDWLKDRIVKQVTSQILKALHIDGDSGIPNDVEANAEDALEWLIEVYVPMLAPSSPRLATIQAAGKRIVDQQVSAFLRGRLAAVMGDVKPLLLTSRATGHPLDRNLRIVRKSQHLLYEEVKRYYLWQGTILNAKLGNLLAGCDPSREFILYLPRQAAPLRVRDTYMMHIIQQDHS